MKYSAGRDLGSLALIILLVTPLARGQAIITTVAGGTWAFIDGGPATSAPLGMVDGPAGTVGVAVDAAGNLYATDQDNNLVFKVSPTGALTVVAGNGIPRFSGDGGPATGASLYRPTGVAVDAAGSIYIADTGNGRIRKVGLSGIIGTVAGNGKSGFSGDGGPATSASLDGPSGVAVDAAGNLYIADSTSSYSGGNNRIRKVSPSGIISTVAGNGTAGFSGDGGLATNASLNVPSGIAVDAADNLYIADARNNRVRRVAPSGIISTVAGGGSGFPGGNGPATSASLSWPSSVAVDAAGNLYITDQGNGRIRKVSPSGMISTAAGSGQGGFTGDGGPATLASLWRPTGVAVDAAGSLYIADQLNNRIRAVSPSGIISTVAGNGTVGSSGDGLSATSASLAGPRGVAVDAGGNLYIADTGNNRVRRVLLAAGQISAAGVTNAASFAAGLTPGSIVTIFGVGIAKGVAGVLLASSLPLPTTLGGISAWIGGVPAPLFAVANVRGQEQINLQVPYEITGQTTVSIQVNANGVLSNTVRVPVLPSHPGIFTVDGEAGAALHGASNALVTAANPVVANEVIAIYAAGLGPVSPAPKTGYPAPSAEPLARTATTPTVTIGGVGAPVLFSGLAPGFVGLYQVNAQVPGGVPPGSAVPVLITQGGLSSNAATIAVR